MDKRTWCVAVAMIGCVSALGCSKKSTVTPDAGSAGSGGTSAAGTGGGAGATAGTMAATGGRPATVTKNVPCGDKGSPNYTECAQAAPNSQMMMIPGFKLADVCCADPANGVCGSMSTSSGMCEAPPAAAPKCPKTFGMPGCCVNNDLCGVDLSLTGMGCQELGKFKMMIPAMFQSFLMIGNATHCDGTPVPMPDAGMTHEDAGM